MAESVKAVCVVVLAVASIVSSLFWFAVDQPNQTTWIVRIATTSLALLSLIILLFLMLRQDIVPDYLQATTKNYFNRDGFCFAILANAMDGVGHWEVWFQNQYAGPCVGRIAIRPNKKCFMGEQYQVDSVVIQIDCPPRRFWKGAGPDGIPLGNSGNDARF